MYPDWTDEVLAEIVPNAKLREQLLAELHPRDLAFFEERFPLNPNWPEAPCRYLQFSAAYEGTGQEAKRLGWTVQRIAHAGHFYMLTNPVEVSRTLIELGQLEFE